MDDLNKPKDPAKEPEPIKNTQVINDPQPIKGDLPSDPYKNFQDMSTTKSAIDKITGVNPDARVYEVNRDYKEEERIKAENMSAKQREIEAPGNLTQDEANALKAGMDPEKQKEIQAQVVDASEKNINKHSDRFAKITDLIGEVLNDQTLGRNATREQLRRLRQNIQNIEVQMDQGKI